MANYWASKGWKISLLTYTDASGEVFYELDRRVRHIPLGLARVSSNFVIGVLNNLHRVGRLRKAIRDSDPEAVISFEDTTNVLTLLATRGLNVPVMVGVRIDPFTYSPGIVWEKLRWLTYSFADRIVVQTANGLKYFSSKFHNRVAVIPNPVSLPPPDTRVIENETISKPCIVSIGRLEEQKGFDLLISAFAAIKDHYPEWTLNILGEGSLRSELTSLCTRLKVQDRVRLMGTVKNPYAILAKADLFVQSSRFEGFPNSLCEAMACGLPVISTDCPSGPRDIIRDGVDGILVSPGSVKALRDGLDRLILDKTLRERLASRSPEVTERFGLEKVMGMWEALLPRSGCAS